ncbi:cadherin-like beta sandwich domain-containing protein [Candidatus Poriferisodalis sp.]|uniref:cadherin-like beta sandwich domain-containing protein n=1 Tax=Candidatus Poriferisodalis sp. TaxID=3101277 RepID=UPI003B02471B
MRLALAALALALVAGVLGPIPASADPDAQGPGADEIGEVEVSSEAPGELTVSWVPPAEEPHEYRVRWAPQDAEYLSYWQPDEERRGNEWLPGDATSLTLSGLDEGGTYKIMLRARWRDEQGRFSAGPWTDEITAVVSRPPLTAQSQESEEPDEDGEADEPDDDGEADEPDDDGEAGEPGEPDEAGQPDGPGLSALFELVPAAHGGPGSQTTVRVRFSEPLDVSYTTMRDEAFEVDGARITRAKRVDGRSDLWDLTLEVTHDGAMTLTLPAGDGCDAQFAVCTADGRALAFPIEAVIAGLEDEPRVARSHFEHGHLEGVVLRSLALHDPVLGYELVLDELFHPDRAAYTTTTTADARYVWVTAVPADDPMTVEIGRLVDGVFEPSGTAADGDCGSESVSEEVSEPPPPICRRVELLEGSTDIEVRLESTDDEGNTEQHRYTVVVAKLAGPEAPLVYRHVPLAGDYSSSPHGVWSDGDTVWVALRDGGRPARVAAYDLASGARNDALCLCSITAAGNGAPWGIWSDGTTMWVVDTDDTKVYAYALAGGERDTAKEFDLHADHINPRGIWSDGTTMWVVQQNSSNQKVFAYALAGGERQQTQEFDLDTGWSADLNDRHGMWSDGHTAWVVDGTARAVIAHRLSDGQHEAANSFSLTLEGATFASADNRDEQPFGVWSDGVTMWVSVRPLKTNQSHVGTRLLAYRMPAGPRLGSLKVSYGDAGGNLVEADIGRFLPATTRYSTVVPATAETVTIEAEEAYADWLTTFSTTDADLDAAGHQVQLEPGLNTVEITVTSPDGFEGAPEDGHITRTYTVEISLPPSLPGARNPHRDILVGEAGLGAISGICRAGDTLWLLEFAPAGMRHAIRAYEYPELVRDPSKDFEITAEASVLGMDCYDTTILVWEEHNFEATHVHVFDSETGERIRGFFADPAYWGGLFTDGFTLWSGAGGTTLYAFNVADGSRTPDRDITLDPDNDRPRGIWSDGTTLWVADHREREDPRDAHVYAYSLVTGERKPGLDISGIAQDPNEIWSDGETMWIAASLTSSPEGRVFAYNLPRGPVRPSLASLSIDGDPQHLKPGRLGYLVLAAQDTVTLSATAAQADWTVTVTAAAPGASPQTLCADGTTDCTVTVPLTKGTEPNTVTITVTDPTPDAAADPPELAERIYTVLIDRPDSSRAGSLQRRIDLDPVGGPGDAELGWLWSDGVTLWTLDSGPRELTARAWDLASGRRTPGSDIISDADPGLGTGLWSDGDTMRILVTGFDSGDYVYAFDLVTGERRLAAETLPHTTSPLIVPPEFVRDSVGLWSDGDTMWIGDDRTDKMAAFKLATGRRRLDADIDIAELSERADLWSDGEIVWVLCGNAICARELVGGARRTDLDFTGLAAAGNSRAAGIWADPAAGIMWVLDAEDRAVYGYQMPPSTALDRLTLTGSGTGTERDGDDFPFGFDPIRLDYRVHVPAYGAGEPEPAAMTLRADTADEAATVEVAYRHGDAAPATADEGVPGSYEIPLARGTTDITVTVSVGDRSRIYRLEVDRRTIVPYARAPDHDLTFDSRLPEGWLWSDGTTMWVSDKEEGKIVAYTVSTGSRDDTKDILLDESNPKPDGIWSDGTTMWVGQGRVRLDGAFAAAHIFAYTLEDGERDESKEFAPEDSAPSGVAGLWSDGTTIWVAGNALEDGVGNSIFAYTLETGARDASKDIGQLDWHRGPTGIWSDGTTMWASRRDNGKVYAYTLDTGARDESKDIDTLVGHGARSPLGIWSDGTWLWTSSAQGGSTNKLYAYNLPRASRLIKEFRIEGADTSAFDPRLRKQSFALPEGLRSLTVTAVPADPLSLVGWTLEQIGHESRGLFQYGQPTPPLDLTRYPGALPSGGTQLFLKVRSPLTADPPAGSDPYLVFVRDRYQIIDIHASVWEDAGDRDLSRYIETEEAGLDRTFGVCATADTFWILEWGLSGSPNVIRAFDRSDLSRDSSKDIVLTDIAPENVYHLDCDGTTLWLYEEGSIDLSVHAVNSQTGALVRTLDVGKDDLLIGPGGVATDGTTVWVGEDNPKRLYAFAAADGERLAGEDIDLHADNALPRGIYLDGTTVWVADQADGFVYAYRQDTHARDPELDIGGIGGNAWDIWSDGETLWVSYSLGGGSAGPVRAYVMPRRTALTALGVSGVDDLGFVRPRGASDTANYSYAATVPSGSTSVTVSYTKEYSAATVTVAAAEAGATVTGDVVDLGGLDEVTVTVTVSFGTESEEYTIVLTRSALAAVSSDASLSALSVQDPDGGEVALGFAASQLSYRTRVTAEVTSVTLTAQPADGSASVEVAADPSATCTGTVAQTCEVAVAPGDNTVTVTVSASDGVAERRYTVVVHRTEALAAEPSRDIELEGAWASSLWSDGETLWVLDRGVTRIENGAIVDPALAGDAAARLHGYSLATGARDPDRDIAPVAPESDDPTAIWFDGDNLWVADVVDQVAYRYSWPDGDRRPTRNLGASTTGLWSNGSILWAAEALGDDLRASPLARPGRISNRDIRVQSSAGDPAIWGVWSDGETIWAADWANGALSAHSLADGSRRAALDFDVAAAGVTNPAALWSDGVTMWVSELQSRRLRAFAMPPSAALASLRLSGDGVDAPLAPRRPSQQVRVPASVASVTLHAQALWPDSAVEVRLGDVVQACDAAAGCALALENGKNTVTVTVTYSGTATPAGVGTRVFEIVVNRTDAGDSAELASLRVHGPDCRPEPDPADPDVSIGVFRAEQLAYSGTVHWCAETVTLTATVPDGSGAEVSVALNGDAVGTCDPAAGCELTLASGDNTVTVAVVSADGTVTRRYTVELYWAAPAAPTPWRDFDLDTAPISIWSDGETMWATGYGVDGHAHAYRLSTGERLADDDIEEDPNDNYGAATGLWGDRLGSIWLHFEALAAVRRYDVASSTLGSTAYRLPKSYWDLWSDGDVLWSGLRAWDLSTGERRADLDEAFADIDADPLLGVWSDGDTMWVAHYNDTRIYAYELASGARREDLEFDTLAERNNGHPRGLWSDGITMWVGDEGDQKVYAYAMPQIEPLLGSLSVAGLDLALEMGRFDYRTRVPPGAKRVTVEAAPFLPGGVVSVQISPPDADANPANGHQVNLSDLLKCGEDEQPDRCIEITATTEANNHRAAASRTYTVVVSRGSQNRSSSRAELARLRVFSAQTDDPADAETGDPLELSQAFAGRWLVRAPSGTDAVRIEAEARDPDAWMCIESGGERTCDEGAEEMEVALAADALVDEATVVVTSADGTTTATHRISVRRASDTPAAPNPAASIFARSAILIPDRDGWGIWSDGTTLWLANLRAQKVYAFARTDGSRRPGRDIDRDEDNDATSGIWSDGQTLWVADSIDNKLYAYALADGSRRSGRDIDLDNDNDDPEGVWSDGDTVWVVDSFLGKLFAYALADGSRRSGRDIDLDNDNKIAQGVWSDGDTVWVADSFLGKLFAYALADGSRRSGRDIELLPANGFPQGMWGDGATLYVMDAVGVLFAYNRHAMAARLRELKVSYADLRIGAEPGATIEADIDFLPHRLGYRYTVPARVETVTIAAAAAAADAEVARVTVAAGSGAARTIAGEPDGGEWRVPLAPGDNTITVAVTAGEHSLRYTVDVHRGHPGSQDPSRDVLLRAPISVFTGHSGVSGVWSDGDYWWAVDPGDLLLWAFEAETGVRSREHEIVLAPGEAFAQRGFGGTSSGDYDIRTAMWSGEWHGEQIVWVASFSTAVLAYELASGHPRPDLDLPVGFELGESAVVGLWSDGVIMWVAFEDQTIEAWDIASRTHLPERDITALAGVFDELAATDINSHALPGDIWSDGDVLWWVSNSLANGDIHVFAVSLVTGMRLRTMDFAVRAHRPTPKSSFATRGMWSDGVTMWMFDSRRGDESELLAVHMPAPRPKELTERAGDDFYGSYHRPDRPEKAVGVLRLGETGTGTLAAGDRDLWRLDVPAGRTYRIEAVFGNSPDTGTGGRLNVSFRRGGDDFLTGLSSIFDDNREDGRTFVHLAHSGATHYAAVAARDFRPDGKSNTYTGPYTVTVTDIGKTVAVVENLHVANTPKQGNKGVEQILTSTERRSTLTGHQPAYQAAQGFTTGSNAVDVHRIDRVEVQFHHANTTGSISLSINAASEGKPAQTATCTFETDKFAPGLYFGNQPHNDDSVIPKKHTFIASFGCFLNPGTEYFLVFGNLYDNKELEIATGDSGTAQWSPNGQGWTIADGIQIKSAGATSWRTSDDNVLRMRLWAESN